MCFVFWILLSLIASFYEANIPSKLSNVKALPLCTSHARDIFKLSYGF